MKTPMQELINKLDYLIGLSEGTLEEFGLKTAKKQAESMLEKEKEVMQDFATDYERECRINLERSIEKCWDETFNTKDDTSKGIN